MQTGKVSEITYKRSILKRLSLKTEGTHVGTDAAPISLEDVTIVMSSNCILKWFEGCEEYYLIKTLNCLREKGGQPEGAQLEINIPTDYEEKLLGKIIKNFDDAVQKKNLPICQCRVYAGQVESPIAHVTLIGRTKYKLNHKDIKAGMDVVMAGSLGLGGTAILAQKYKNRLLEKFTNTFTEECIELKNLVNIEKAASIAIDCEAVYMHNISDGGVFGAIWELASAADMGITVNIPDIPVWQQVIEVAEVLGTNPYMLDGTGALLIVCRDGKKITDELTENGILANVIGVITDTKDRIALNKEETRYLEPPKGDELYKFI